VARDPKYDILFEPVRVGPKTMRNRFWQVPQCTGAGSEMPDFQAQFRAMKAEGGWAAIFTEACTIAPEADSSPLVTVTIWDDSDVRNLRRTTDAVHEHGSLMGIELYYGDQPTSPDSRMTRRAPSQGITDFNSLGTAKPMTKQDIREIRQLYVEAAIRSRDAGFDLITLYATHGHTMLSQFMLPAYNHRTDEYGGSFENRARFAREVTESVREAIGDDCAVGIRWGVDSLPAPYGLGELGVTAAEDGFRFIAHLDDLVDYWDLNVGPNTMSWGEDAAPSRTHPENHERQYVMGAKDHTTKPVVNVGRFTNPDTMVQIIRDGQCDLIGAARPSIADPFLPKKIENGQLDEIRECIGCNICISKWEPGGRRIACTQNATSGEEFRRGWHPERFTPAANRDNDVLVVGAGPAGMECAVVLGKRQMRRVHLVDAAPEPGGSVNWISRLPGLGEWARIVNYRQIQIAKLKNVSFIPDTRLTVDDVLEYGAEIVVVATGATWSGDGRGPFMAEALPGAGAEQPHILTPEPIMVDGKQAGDRVLVYDAEGYFMGHSLAARLRAEGKQVTLVTTQFTVSPYSMYTLEWARLNRELREAGVRIVLEHLLLSAEPGAATIMDFHTDAEEVLDVDSIVMVTQRVPNAGLWDELQARRDEWEAAGIVAVHEVGDAVAPDMLHQAIFSGHRLGREIDSDDPAQPLPYVRERRVVNATDGEFVPGSPLFSPRVDVTVGR
jgi:dimethylamine/trimethylamine dehydrogenase